MNSSRRFSSSKHSCCEREASISLYMSMMLHRVGTIMVNKTHSLYSADSSESKIQKKSKSNCLLFVLFKR